MILFSVCQKKRKREPKSLGMEIYERHNHFQCVKKSGKESLKVWAWKYMKGITELEQRGRESLKVWAWKYMKGITELELS